MSFARLGQSDLSTRSRTARIKNGFSLNKAEVGDYLVSVERSGLPMINVAKMARAEIIAEANELVKAGRMRVALPLVGVKQRLSQGAMERIQRQILEEEGIKPENFRVNARPEMSGRGGLRAVVAPIKGFKLLDISAVAANHRACQADLSFMLLRGSYATVLLREIMKPSNLIKAGF